MTNRPIVDKVKRLRQRQMASGKWRVWWEPEGNVRALGFEVVELDANKPTWSVRQAKGFNDEVDRVRSGGDMGPKTPSGGRTMSALIETYRRSHKFKQLKAGSLQGYISNINAIDDKWGTASVSQFSKPIMYEWYQSLLNDKGPTVAKALVTMMSILFSFAELKGWRPENSNPCFRLGMQSVRKRKRSASWAEFDQLIKSADALGMPAMACGIAMATLNAQRQSEVVAADIQGIRTVMVPDVLGTPRECLIWELVRSKKSNYGIMPMHPELELRVRAMMAGRSKGALLLDHATGAPYSGDLFRKRWATIREHASRTLPSLTMPGNVLQFRDLRRTFGVFARAGGASKADVGDVLGNSAGTDPQLGETYMPPSFHTAARAVYSIKRPDQKANKQ